MMRIGQEFNLGEMKYTILSMFSDNDKVFCVAKTVMGDFSNYKIFWCTNEGKLILCS